MNRYLKLLLWRRNSILQNIQKCKKQLLELTADLKNVMEVERLKILRHEMEIDVARKRIYHAQGEQDFVLKQVSHVENLHCGASKD